MALKKLGFKPGFNKQTTASGAEGEWIDGDFVRFRYGLPEKIGGWRQLTIADKTLPGVARAQHTWAAISGEKYAAIGTHKGLFLFYGDAFYDITPLDTAITSCTFSSTTTLPIVTVNKTSHNLSVGDYFTFSSTSLPGGGETGYTTADFDDIAYEVITVPNANSFTVTMASNESGSGMSAQGSTSVNPYVTVGPAFQTPGYGWGTYLWGDSTWGTARTVSDVVLDPGNWSLDNFGQILIATIADGRTFTWDAGASGARSIRATIMSGAPTASRLTLVSDRDRHLFHFGTETTIGNTSTQDPMFIRFSNQEDYNTYTPTATNTAGTFRLDAGNKIVGAISGKDYVFVLTDTAAYVIQFVGPPFTFSVRQVGTNCGLISQHALSYSNGTVFWMSGEGGFFVYDGTVKAIPCLVEDFVFTNDGDNLGINYDAAETTYAEHNSLYTEINWFYPKANSTQIDRCVTYNYGENVWYTSSLARTTYADQGVFDLPYATQYSTTATPNFMIQGVTNLAGASTYYAHESGADQVNSSGTTSINAYVLSGDLDIDDGEIFSSISRFVPDYKYIEGNSKVTIFLNDYPNNTSTSSPLGPFTVNSSTDKIDTRARGRLISIKIANDAVGETWRYGTLRIDARPDGRR
jgi:hypothetical protein